MDAGRLASIRTVETSRLPSHCDMSYAHVPSSTTHSWTCWGNLGGVSGNDGRWSVAGDTCRGIAEAGVVNERKGCGFVLGDGGLGASSSSASFSFGALISRSASNSFAARFSYPAKSTEIVCTSIKASIVPSGGSFSSFASRTGKTSLTGREAGLGDRIDRRRSELVLEFSEISESGREGG